jgi:hypothetical protein
MSYYKESKYFPPNQPVGANGKWEGIYPEAGYNTFSTVETEYACSRMNG